MKKSFLKAVAGDSSFDLRHRILNTFFFTIALFLLIAAFTNLFVEQTGIVIGLTFFASAVFFFFFYLSRGLRMYNTAHFIAWFTFGMLFVYHKYDGGIGCGTGFYIIMVTVGIISVFNGAVKVFYLVILSIISLFLLLLEVNIPGYVLEISSKTCFVNNVLAFLLTSASVAFLLQVFLSTYLNYAKMKEKLSLTDPLTGLLNRRAFYFELKNQIPLLKRKHIPFSIIMFDFDNFKKINDTYGHRCGDRVLKIVARLVNESLKAGDLLCRWGGEEFVIFLPYSRLQTAYNVAERLRRKVEKVVINCNRKNIPVTITLGVKQYDFEQSIDENIESVDLAMYKGKREGKNTVVVV